MISIVVCTIDDVLFNRFSKSLNSTIGVPFEIIKIENKIENLSIAKAYNKGAIKTKFEILVFVHEDVVFHSENWGSKLLNHFDTLPNPGVLGIAGSSYLPISPTDWWMPNKKKRFFNFLDNHNNLEIGMGIHKFSNTLNPTPVFLLDGMFLACKKDVINKIKFDEDLEGFHGYDTSICLRASKNFTNYFIPDILIEHFSPGHPNHIWIKNTILAFQKFDRSQMNLRLDRDMEEKCYHLFLNNLNKLEHDWVSRKKESGKFLNKLLSEFFSLKLIAVWFWYQLFFLKDKFLEFIIYDFKKN